MNDLAEIEQRVRRTCTAIAKRTGVGTEWDDVVAPATGRRAVRPRFARPGRRRVAIRLAAAAAVIAVAGAAVALAPDRSDDTGSVVTGSATEGSTTAVPEAPIDGRGVHNAVWTGTEMIVFGGENDQTIGWGAPGAAHLRLAAALVAAAGRSPRGAPPRGQHRPRAQRGVDRDGGRGVRDHRR
jgi:hypothetical protein